MKWLSPIVLAVAVLTGVTVAPADDPEVPEKYVTVDEVNARFDRKMPVTVIDVRSKE